MSEELKFPDRASKADSDSLGEPLVGLIRRAYLPPVSAADSDVYWSGLEQRIMTRVRSGGGESGWWSELVPWARIGLAAAAVIFAIAGLVNQQIVADDARWVSYESVVDTAAPEMVSASEEPFASQYGSTDDNATALRTFLSN